MTSTRFLTGSLATLAIASAFTLAAPAAQAAEEQDRPCGLPAIAAVYDTVVVPPVFRTVPAVVHSEWLWEREVATYEYEFSKLISPATVENDWSREVPGPVEFLFTRIVIDSPAVPAIPAVPEIGHWQTVVTTPAVVVTEVEYQHERTGNLRWEDETWGAQNGAGSGWSKTGNTRTVEITPAVTTQVWIVDVPGTPAVPEVPEVSHVESEWATTAPAGTGWAPVDERPGPTSTENATTDGDAPAGDGWALVDSRTTDAVIDTVWADTTPDGYTPTGATRVAGSNREETDATTQEAPEGEGWAKIVASEIVVTDAAEYEELVTPGSTEQVLVSPAVPASDPCPAAPEDEVSGPEDTVEVEAPAQAAPAPVAEVLPNTGNELPAWMLPTGVGVMLAGIGMIRLGRRVEN